MPASSAFCTLRTIQEALVVPVVNITLRLSATAAPSRVCVIESTRTIARRCARRGMRRGKHRLRTIRLRARPQEVGAQSGKAQLRAPMDAGARAGGAWLRARDPRSARSCARRRVPHTPTVLSPSLDLSMMPLEGAARRNRARGQTCVRASEASPRLWSAQTANLPPFLPQMAARASPIQISRNPSTSPQVCQHGLPAR
jgi:hypothetical protein